MSEHLTIALIYLKLVMTEVAILTSSTAGLCRTTTASTAHLLMVATAEDDGGRMIKLITAPAAGWRSNGVWIKPDAVL